MDAQARVEIFLRTKGRLPNKPDDKLDKKMVKEFLDKCHTGEIEEKHHYLMPLAFSIYGEKTCIEPKEGKE